MTKWARPATTRLTPEEVTKKRIQQDKLQAAIRNYLEFIKAGNMPKAVAEALSEAEQGVEELKAEIGSLEFQSQNRFQAPPQEWIQHRLEQFQETLNRNTIASALALKEVLGSIRMEPVLTQEEDPLWGLGEKGEIASVASLPCNDGLGEARNDEGVFKPYYVAHTKIQTLALLDEGHKGTNWLQWRRG